MTKRHAIPFVSLFLMGPILVCLVGCKPEPPELPRIFAADISSDSSRGSTIDPNSKYSRFNSEIRQLIREPLPAENHEDFAMLAANRAMLYRALHRPEQAKQMAMRAQAVMTGYVEGEEGKATLAAIASESEKVFKGEMYEIAAVNVLIGLCSLELNDPETAGIGFRRALEADRMSAEEHRDDFNLAYWGLGMSLLDTDLSEANNYLRRAGYKPAEQTVDDNVVLVISMGRAPWKLLTGLYGCMDQIMLSPYEPKSAIVFVDGKPLGKAVELINLYKQAQGVEFTEKDAGQAAKAAGKYAAVIAASFVNANGLVQNLWDVTADPRHCYMLPDSIHALSAKVSPGRHTIRVRFLNAAGEALPRYEQVWNNLVAPESGRVYMNIRSEFDRCNVQGPIAFTKIRKSSTKNTGSKESPETTTTVTFQADNVPGIRVGTEVELCYFYKVIENRTCVQDNWRHKPLVYNRQGQAIGYPGVRHRATHYEVGLIGKAEVTKVKGKEATAVVTSLTTDYLPKSGDMVTSVKKIGNIWK